MADNLLQFRTRIRRYLRELNPETSFWTDSFLNQLFNAQYRRRCTQLIMAFEGWFVLVAIRDIESGKSTYGFPDGLQRLQKTEMVRSDGRTVPIERHERHDEANVSNSTVGGGDQYSPTYRMLGNGIVLEPDPIAAVTGGLRIEYAGLPVMLSADTDKLNPSFPEILDELVVLDTTVAALQAEGVHEQGPMAAIFRLREEWEWDWERFIDQRTISRDKIDPFIPHYQDA